MKMNLRGRCDGVDVTASLRAGDDPGAARLHDALPDRRRDGRRARVARLQARPVVHAREDPRLVDPYYPDVRRHRGDHSLDLPAGGLRVVPVELNSLTQTCVDASGRRRRVLSFPFHYRTHPPPYV